MLKVKKHRITLAVWFEESGLAKIIQEANAKEES